MSTDEALIAEGKNKFTVYCSRCPSKILNSGMGIYTDMTYNLPFMHHKTDGDSENVEDVKGYWQVSDIYTFENLGFSNTIENMKYLICADCEIGPIGWHDLGTKQSYVALSRVKHS
ncbi:guanine nucleotide exchange factor MSS4 homolog [Halyomorpha halys]|uniref:guanine nucleotide exchange factor MSS4 homolog n=1 Tax=Halyomorpha halys TaxID=286706 RepID=UPI0006D521DB|nr:guanine nucleotide exchange factor MSS4 homolog [Halyomorpha halys]